MTDTPRDVGDSHEPDPGFWPRFWRRFKGQAQPTPDPESPIFPVPQGIPSPGLPAADPGAGPVRHSPPAWVRAGGNDQTTSRGGSQTHPRPSRRPPDNPYMKMGDDAFLRSLLNQLRDASRRPDAVAHERERWRHLADRLERYMKGKGTGRGRQDRGGGFERDRGC